MNRFKKHISVFLLLVFAWVALPPSFVHSAFADHHDTSCAGHSHKIIQVESKHRHCDVFNSITPVYDIPFFDLFETPFPFLSAELSQAREKFHFCFFVACPESRGPPRCIV